MVTLSAKSRIRLLFAERVTIFTHSMRNKRPVINYGKGGGGERLQNGSEGGWVGASFTPTKGGGGGRFKLRRGRNKFCGSFNSKASRFNPHF